MRDKRRETRDERALKLNKLVLIFAVLFLASSAFAWPWSSKEKTPTAEDQERIKDSLQLEEVRSLQREVETLTRIRLQKADSLEKLEAEHWKKRYAESQLTEEHQAETRELDGRYSKLSTDLGRVNEEVMASKNVTGEAEENAKAEESAYDALNTQVKLSIDKTLGEVTGDYPVGMNGRLVRLKQAAAEADAQNPNTLGAARGYLTDFAPGTDLHAVLRPRGFAGGQPPRRERESLASRYGVPGRSRRGQWRSAGIAPLGCLAGQGV